MTPHEQVKEKIESLAAIMISETPRLPSVLSDIRILLGKNPDVVTLLTEEEIGQLVNGMAVRANAKFAEVVVKTKRVSLKNTSVADL
jgi:hypothetical protein